MMESSLGNLLNNFLMNIPNPGRISVDGDTTRHVPSNLPFAHSFCLFGLVWFFKTGFLNVTLTVLNSLCRQCWPRTHFLKKLLRVCSIIKKRVINQDRHGVQEAGKSIKKEQEMWRGNDWQIGLSWVLHSQDTLKVWDSHSWHLKSVGEDYTFTKQTAEQRSL